MKAVSSPRWPSLYGTKESQGQDETPKKRGQNKVPSHTPMRAHPPRTPRQCGLRWCRVRLCVCVCYPRYPRSVSTEKCSRSAVRPQYLLYPATSCAARAFLPKRRRVSTGRCMDNLQCSSMPNVVLTPFCLVPTVEAAGNFPVCPFLLGVVRNY